MKTLLRSPYLHGPWWIILLVVLFAAVDMVRATFNWNLGRLPMGIKLLYLRVFLYEFMPIYDPQWRLAKRPSRVFGLPSIVCQGCYGCLNNPECRKHLPIQVR